MTSGTSSGNKVSSRVGTGPLQARLQNISWAFAAAFVLHALFAALLVLSFAHTPAPKKTVGPRVEVVQAVAVDESRVQAELERIRQEELRKQQAEQARLRKLEADARKARQARENEQQRLAELKRKQAAEKKRLEAENKAEQARLARLKADQQALEQKRKQEETRLAALDAQRKAEEEKRKQEALAQKKRAEELQRQEEARKKEEAEAKRLAEEQRKRDEAARLAREEELRQQLAAEEQRLATLREKYISSIQAKVQRNWRRPPGISDGATCEVLVNQLPGGLVHTVSVAGCSGGDEILLRSVKTAVLKAEPLPAPPDPSVFDREIRFVFVVTR